MGNFIRELLILSIHLFIGYCVALVLMVIGTVIFGPGALAWAFTIIGMIGFIWAYQYTEKQKVQPLFYSSVRV